MIVQCAACQTRFKIADEKVTDRGVKVRCSKCANTFVVRKTAVPPPDAPVAAVPKPFSPGANPSGGDPLAALTGGKPAPSFEAATNPGLFLGDLPDLASDDSPFKEVTRVGISLAHIQASRPNAPLPPPAVTPPQTPAVPNSTAADAGDPFAGLQLGPTPPPVTNPAGASSTPATDPFAGLQLGPTPPPVTNPAGASSTPATDPFAGLQLGPTPPPVATPAGAPGGDPFGGDLGVSDDPFAALGPTPPPTASATPADAPAPSPPGDDFFGPAPAKDPFGSGALPSPGADPFGAGAFDFGADLGDGSPQPSEPFPSPGAVDSPFQSPGELDLGAHGAGAERSAASTGPESPIAPVQPAPEAPRPQPVTSRAPHAAASTVRSAALKKKQRRPKNTATALLNALLFALLGIGLLAALFVVQNEGNVSLSDLSVETALRTLAGKGAGDHPVRSVGNGLYETRSGKPVFFVRGRVENRTGTSSHLRVKVELLRGSEPVRTMDGVAGAIPTPEELYELTGASAFARLREQLAPRGRPVEAGGSEEFVVVFYEYPDEISDLKLRVTAGPFEPAAATAPAPEPKPVAPEPATDGAPEEATAAAAPASDVAGAPPRKSKARPVPPLPDLSKDPPRPLRLNSGKSPAANR